MNKIIITFFLILTIFTGEAKKRKDPNNCAQEAIMASLQNIEAKCREFVIDEIEKHLQDPSITGKQLVCLTQCLASYQTAIGFLAKAVIDVSSAQYVDAIKDITNFVMAIAPCIKCCADFIVKDPELENFQKWANSNVEALQKQLNACQISH